MKRKLKVCSLFSGIGGFEFGLYKAIGRENVEIVFASEIDKYAAKSYEVYHKHKPQGDITQISVKDIPEHDLLVAGFPCQSFSVAGRRLGFEDARGTLFFEIARVLKEKKPKMFLLENVKGLLGHDEGNTMRVIVETLNQLGYTIDFEVLNSKYFNVPQSRERVFFVGFLNGKTENWDIGKKNNVLNKTKRKIEKELDIKTFNFNFPKQEKVCTVLNDILENEVEEKYYLSEEKTKNLLNRLSGEFKERTEAFLIDDQGRKDKNLKPLNLSPTLRREMHGNEPRVVEKTSKEVIKSKEEKDFLVTKEKSKIAIEFDRKVGIGKELEISHTISASDWRGLNRNQKQNAVLERKEKSELFNHKIRKLTPLECFRLQSFPEDLYFELKKAKISDTQLYKIAGNAVTANVVEGIIKEMLK